MSAHLILVALLPGVSLSSCSTVAGLGEDLRKAESILKIESREFSAIS